jgi:hypothetical protein
MMIPEEVPASEQLMDLTVRPSVPNNQRFFFEGLIWPTQEALDSPASQAHPGPERLEDTVGWVERVLKPAWVAPDLRTRLRAARAIVTGRDAFLTRYAMNQNKIQIVVTRFHVHLVIAPPGGVPPGRVPEVLHEYLQVDRPEDKTPWSGGPWEMGRIDGLTFGYQPRSALRDWREGIYYLTNGRAVKFSLRKVATRPPGSGPPKSGFAPSEEAERNWFDERP